MPTYLQCGYHQYGQESNSYKTNGFYAEVLFAQGTAKSSYSLVIPTKFDAGLMNTLGVCVFKDFKNVSLWWYALGTTSLAITITILAAALAGVPEGQVRLPNIPRSYWCRWMAAMSEPRLRCRHRTSLGSILTGRMSHKRLAVVSLNFRVRCKRAYDRGNHNTAISGLIDIIVAFDVSAVPGRFFILGLLFSIQDFETMFTSPMGQSVTQIILDMVGKKGVIVFMESDISHERRANEDSFW